MHADEDIPINAVPFTATPNRIGERVQMYTITNGHH